MVCNLISSRRTLLAHNSFGAMSADGSRIILRPSNNANKPLKARGVLRATIVGWLDTHTTHAPTHATMSALPCAWRNAKSKNRNETKNNNNPISTWLKWGDMFSFVTLGLLQTRSRRTTRPECNAVLQARTALHASTTATDAMDY